MIKLTRLNGQFMAVNADLIKFVEALPDTVITLLTGEKVVVNETPDQVIARVIDFKMSIAASCSQNSQNAFCWFRAIGPDSQNAPEERLDG